MAAYSRLRKRMVSSKRLATALLLLLLVATATTAQDQPLTHDLLRKGLAAKPKGNDATQLADRIRAWFGKDNLTRGATVKVEGLNAAWAVELPGVTGTIQVTSDDPQFRLPMIRVGSTDVYAATTTLSDGAAYEMDLRCRGEAHRWGNVEAYKIHPDGVEKPGLPKGTLTQQPRWKSRIFGETERDWWVYIPAQYKAENPACVMVFQDGGGMKNYVPVVLDNLIAAGDMPVTVGVFINPGTFSDGRSNRSFEYDTLSDQYARFLLEEILPEVEKGVKLRHDAASRAIAGISSGGICAWTVAWERPGEFSKVLSWVGSFTNIASGKSLREGGHNYAALIRKTDKKPIRVFLQDGENDLDNPHGSWWLANQQMARSLAFKGYDYKVAWGRGFHSPAHGRAILPDSLRWLWRDHRP